MSKNPRLKWFPPLLTASTERSALIFQQFLPNLCSFLPFLLVRMLLQCNQLEAFFCAQTQLAKLVQEVQSHFLAFKFNYRKLVSGFWFSVYNFKETLKQLFWCDGSCLLQVLMVFAQVFMKTSFAVSLYKTWIDWIGQHFVALFIVSLCTLTHLCFVEL